MTMAQPLTIFDVAGRAMSAQLVRMNTTASNLANAGGVAGSEADAYRSMKPVFKTSYDKASGLATVDVQQVVTAGPAPTKRHDPNHPMADANGDVFEAAVDESRVMLRGGGRRRPLESVEPRSARSVLVESAATPADGCCVGSANAERS